MQEYAGYLSGMLAGLIIGYVAGYLDGVKFLCNSTIDDIQAQTTIIGNNVKRILIKTVFDDFEDNLPDIIENSSSEEDLPEIETILNEPEDLLPIYMENKILADFRDIEGSLYNEMELYIDNEGYRLCPVYVNDVKQEGLVYNVKTLGVSIADDHFDGVPSNEAIILELVDIGGVDYYSRYKS